MAVILHVEDDLLMRKALALMLETAHYSLSGAASGREAIRLVRAGLRPDLLIVDFALDEDMNGAESAERLRNEIGYAPPVIMLTGNPGAAALPWITDAPIWLACKPMDPRLPLAAVPHLVQLSRATRKLTSVAR